MKVELISKTLGVGSYSELNSEEIIAAVARHGTIKEDNGRLVKYLMEHKHWSPLEHITFGFKIETSRAIATQILRHRSMVFQQTSQRYSKTEEFEPVELRKQHKSNRQSSTEVFNPLVKGLDGKLYTADDFIFYFLEDVNELYNNLLDAGVARECARMILPLCSKTTLHVTGNLRNLLSFLNVRMEEHSQKEIQDIALEIGLILEKELPNIFSKIDWKNGLFM